jgi:deoxycytidylate deaminase
MVASTGAATAAPGPEATTSGHRQKVLNVKMIERPELVFALVGPAGTRLSDLSNVLKEHVRFFSYQTVDIRLSDLLPSFSGWTPEKDQSEYTRIKHRQAVAYDLRKALGGDALARAGIARIREMRKSLTGDPDKPAAGCAYIISQLKHPTEVRLLREVYGTSLIVLGGHAPMKKRVDALAQTMADKDSHGVDAYRSKAEEIVYVDMKAPGDDDLGQNTRDTYPLADFFADLGRASGENSLRRFVDLLFGHPFHTPTPDEYAMYQAHAGSLRSSDESRQVGAVIVEFAEGTDRKTRNASVVATGMNEVPRRGGLLYGEEDSPDGRDQWLMAYREQELAKKIKIETLVELIERINECGWLSEAKSREAANLLAHELLPHLKETHFMNIGEFGRTVHAEMAALIDAAKRGVAVRGLTMFVTTFPCHNCAKHIIAAGLKRVVYMEPYPKSRAADLHGDEMELDPPADADTGDKVAFVGFTGVAPRQYGRVFSMMARGKKNGLALAKWNQQRDALLPKYVARNASASYLLAEREELMSLTPDSYKWDSAGLCPQR